MIKSSATRPGAHPPVATAADIAVAVRARIVGGSLTAGQRLPTHVRLEQQFHSTPPTVAKALTILKREGFIRAERGRAMFVADRPPHRHHYALAFEFRQDERLSQFYVALRNEAARFQSDGRRFSLFYEIGEHTDTDDYQRLLGFVRSHRLAGLIFAQAPYRLVGTDLLEEPDIPRVAIASGAVHPGVPVVGTAGASFLPRALDALAADGRRRVALLRKTPTYPESDTEVADFTRAVAARGLHTRPCWVQAVHPETPRHAKELIELLLFAPPRLRPDALIIRDDNLVEPATAGLVAAGVRVPEQMTVIAHTNFPWPTPSAVPVRRLGYDVHRLLELCLERVDALRRGERPRQRTLLPAVFEEQLATRSLPAELQAPR